MPGQRDEQYLATSLPLPDETRAYVAQLTPLLSAACSDGTPFVKNDHTRTLILPMAARLNVRSDNVGLPMMLLRHADGRMHYDESRAASM